MEPKANISIVLLPEDYSQSKHMYVPLYTLNREWNWWLNLNEYLYAFFWLMGDIIMLWDLALPEA